MIIGPSRGRPPALLSFLTVLFPLLFASPLTPLEAEEAYRFKPPDFTNHPVPVFTPQEFPIPLVEWVDMGLLVLVLGLATYLIYRKRSRKLVFAVMVFSVLWFGFYRKGCICPFGAIQNIAQGLFDPGFAIPLTALVFFFIPLFGTLLFGRTYCAAVCPHGALQDAVVWKPMAVPAWLDHALGLIPFFYLGLGVLFAATGSAYIICEYDPLVPLFRMSGSLNMLMLGGLFLFLGTVVGRPYCRYLCPYGALLRLASQVSRWRIKIYPDRCIDCRLCDQSCPFRAIRPATPAVSKIPRAEGKGLLVGLLILLPILVVLLAWAGSHLAGPFSRMNFTVRLADKVKEAQTGVSGRSKGAAAPPRSEKPALEGGKDADPTSDVLLAFGKTNKSPGELFARAAEIHARFQTGGWWFGAFVGLTLGLKLIALSVRRRRLEYEADRAGCVACARCFEYCPGEKGLDNPEATAKALIP